VLRAFRDNAWTDILGVTQGIEGQPITAGLPPQILYPQIYDPTPPTNYTPYILAGFGLIALFIVMKSGSKPAAPAPVQNYAP